MVMIWFDGLCEPNPGGLATWAYVIDGVTGDPLDPVTACGVLAPDAGNTNNVAEYYGLGMALKFLVESRVKVDELRIYGDSQLVVNQLKGKWQCNAEQLVKLRDRCYGLLKKLGLPREKVSAEWIPRDQNGHADSLSRAAFIGWACKLPPERHGKADDTKSK